MTTPQLEFPLGTVHPGRIRRRPKAALYLAAIGKALQPAPGSESDVLYTAVMYLRSAGKTVYRAGDRKHLVAGAIVSTHHLVRMRL